MPTKPSKTLETFPNPKPERDYTIRIESPEFTCLCPKTGQPDFATILVEYIPDQSCIELKSYKLYLWSYREEGAFHEAVTNKILDDLVAACCPRWMKVEARFNVRGGIYTTVTAEYRAPSQLYHPAEAGNRTHHNPCPAHPPQVAQDRKMPLVGEEDHQT